MVGGIDKHHLGQCYRAGEAQRKNKFLSIGWCGKYFFASAIAQKKWALGLQAKNPFSVRFGL
ncbi:MAG: hypothetical protein QM529_06280 [Hydrotalea sp.]|nr:hypothetical protein [Hydrotalea sp.]